MRARSADFGAGRGQRVAILLVHGTFGRGMRPRDYDATRPRWFERGSAVERRFGEVLREHGFDVVSTEGVPWSGANAILDRDTAARALATRLDRLHEDDPAVLRLIVGHSHGGNVCLRAFAHLERPPDGIRVATLATPFVELTGGRNDRSVSLLIGLVAVSGLVLRLGEWIVGRTPAPFTVLLLWAAMLAVVGGVPLTWFVASRLRGITDRVVEASSHAPFRAAAPPTLVLRGIDDEASLTLALGAVAARLSHLSTAGAVAIFETARHLFGVALAIAGMIAAFAVVGERLRAWLVGSMLDLGNAWGPLVFGIVAALALLEGVAPAVFGRELFGTYLNLQVSSNSTPDAGEHLRTATLLPHAEDEGLRHALYTHPACARTIADWLVETPPSTPPPTPL